MTSSDQRSWVSGVRQLGKSDRRLAEELLRWTKLFESSLVCFELCNCLLEVFLVLSVSLWGCLFSWILLVDQVVHGWAGIPSLLFCCSFACKLIISFLWKLGFPVSKKKIQPFLLVKSSCHFTICHLDFMKLDIYPISWNWISNFMYICYYSFLLIWNTSFPLFFPPFPIRLSSFPSILE